MFKRYVPKEWAAVRKRQACVRICIEQACPVYECERKLYTFDEELIG
jgi:hypothetical protein